MNGYVAFYNDKRLEVYADTMFEAKDKAIDIFKPSKKNAWKVSVCLAELNDNPVVHVADM